MIYYSSINANRRGGHGAALYRRAHRGLPQARGRFVHRRARAGMPELLRRALGEPETGCVRTVHRLDRRSAA